MNAFDQNMADLYGWLKSAPEGVSREVSSLPIGGLLRMSETRQHARFSLAIDHSQLHFAPVVTWTIQKIQSEFAKNGAHAGKVQH